MAIHRLRSRRSTVLVVTTVLALTATGSAAGASQPLPPGAQVNDDQAAGINAALGVDGSEPSNADLVGGALNAGTAAVPWSVFRQKTSGHDQVFSRSFAGGTWTTRGNGTFGGRSDAVRPFSGSLNFDQSVDGEAPSLDFAGAGRTVPWATWYESTSGSGFQANNIFASRFDNTGDANQGKWIFGGQSRGTGGGGIPIPSLNIHPDHSAENPSIAAGSAADPANPGPWVTWQETTTLPVAGKDQIFVTRALLPASPNCDGVTPTGVSSGTDVPAVGDVCWQQTGVPRVGTGSADPSLNVDPTRDGIEPDLTFAGTNDSVPWVVWTETGVTNTGISGLTHTNGMVFAAEGISDGLSSNGGFHWVAVGNQLQGTLDTTGGNGFGPCAVSDTAEAQCSLNKDPAVDAEDPQVAAGTMTGAGPTVPWVAWEEKAGGIRQVFVSRLVGTGAAAHFELVNGGAPISAGTSDSTRPAITFSGNTPYVTWREDVGGGVVRAFVGHFVNPASPTFVLDEGDVALASTAQADVREPISSSCPANPSTADGSTCPGAAVGTPFFLSTSGTVPLSLFAHAYQPGSPVTVAATGITTSSATLNGTVNPGGAPVRVSFQYGTSTAYGQSTPTVNIGPDNASDGFSAALGSQAAGTTIHYRAVASSDFATFFGGDQTLTTASPPPPPPPPPTPGPGKVSWSKAVASGASAKVRVTCKGVVGAKCRLVLRLTVTEKLRGHQVIGVAALTQPKTRKVVVIVGGPLRVTLLAGQSKVEKVSLAKAGKRLLASRHTLKLTLRMTQTLTGGHSRTLTQVLTFKAPKPKPKPKPKA
jgi:hypothetical protein